jgi:hypothetical protein
VGKLVLRICIASDILWSSLNIDLVIACRSTSADPSKDLRASDSVVDTHMLWISRVASWDGA